MRTNYDRQLKKLNDEMVEMGSMIEGVIEKAIKALVNQDVDLAQEVIRRDDQIDQQEKDIESLCFKLLLMEQPVATDLRQVSSALKMVTDMERIGDHAADISELTIQIKTLYTGRLISSRVTDHIIHPVCQPEEQTDHFHPPVWNRI